MGKEFELFVREKRLLTGVTEKTIEWYRASRAAYYRYLKAESLTLELSKTQLNRFNHPPLLSFDP
jgi:hypothetical protein